MTTEDRSCAVVAVFDLDGTITDCDTYVEFLKRCLVRRPSRIFRSLHLPIAVLLHKAGLYDNSWLKETFLSAIAAACPEDTLQDIVDNLVEDLLKKHVRTGAVQAIEAHQEAGHRLLLASASFDFYVMPLAARLGFDEVVCTKALRDPDNTLTGKIDGQNCYGAGKVDAVLKALPDRDNCALTAYSDHHSDWALLEMSDTPVAVNPTSALRDLADKAQVEVKMW